MNNHFLIFAAPQGGHSAVILVRASSRYDALRVYFENEYSGSWTLHEDGTVTEAWSRHTNSYPHLLAFIESDRKGWGEWQMRRLHENTWDAECREVFCGERAPDVENLYDICRPVFRKDFPRSRAPAFLWYLKGGYLVTFFRPVHHRPIEILGRYLIPHETYPDVVRWEGDYAEILERLSL